MTFKKKGQKFTEKDIVINSMHSRRGKATEFLHLALAKIKKLQKEDGEENEPTSSIRSNVLGDRRKQM